MSFELIYFKTCDAKSKLAQIFKCLIRQNIENNRILNWPLPCIHSPCQLMFVPYQEYRFSYSYKDSGFGKKPYQQSYDNENFYQRKIVDDAPTYK